MFDDRQNDFVASPEAKSRISFDSATWETRLQASQTNVESDDAQPDCEWFCKAPSRLRVAAIAAATQVAAGLQYTLGNRSDDGFAILMYHRVAEHVPGVAKPTFNVAPGQLHRQLSGLLARGFEAWPLSSLVKARREGRAVPANAFAITFDDGYENNYLNARPILKELNVPATIFVATLYLDTDRPFPFDDWPATESSGVPPSAWRPLSSNQCRELLAGGLIELGAHTHSHKRFLGRRDEFRRDLRLCLDVLYNRFGVEQPTFAFPYGNLSPELTDAAKQLGVACCLSTRHRRVQPGDDVYQWGRFNVGASDTPTVLAAKLSGWYTAVSTAGQTLALPLTTLAQTVARPSRSSISSDVFDKVART